MRHRQCVGGQYIPKLPRNEQCLQKENQKFYF